MSIFSQCSSEYEAEHTIIVCRVVHDGEMELLDLYNLHDQAR
jgi:hypothetical protein